MSGLVETGGTRPAAAAATTVKRITTQATRKHDNIYDPVYVSSSGDRGHYMKYNANMMTNLQRRPVYKNMFSDYRPAHDVAFKPDKTGVPILPPSGLHKTMSATEHHTVTGTDLTKYFKRPNVPFLHDMQNQVLMTTTQSDSKQVTSKKEIVHIQTPRVRAVGVQTLYRDSETQTDPYTPDYILPEDTPEPEILSIAHFSQANGMLPVAQHEVDIINRMRDKKKFMDSLPEITDEKSLEKRKAMLAAQEKREWKYREQEMKEEQNAKLQMLIEKIRKRDERAEEYLSRRQELLVQAKLRQRTDKLQEMHMKRVKGFRKMGKEAKAQPKRTNRDMIAEYADHDSEIYAPLRRVGKLPAKNQVVDYGIPLIQDSHGLNLLEQRISHELKPKKVKIEDEVLDRRGKIVKSHLEHVDRIIQGKDVDAGAENIKNLYKKLQPNVRPKTPEISTEPDAQRDSAATFLQKFIRGRAMQNEMYEQKKRYLPLIRELQIDEKLQKEGAHATEKSLQRQNYDGRKAEETQTGLGDSKLNNALSLGIDLLSGHNIFQTLSRISHYAKEVEAKKLRIAQAKAKKQRDAAEKKVREADQRTRREEEKIAAEQRAKLAKERQIEDFPEKPASSSAKLDGFLDNLSKAAAADASLSSEADPRPTEKDREVVADLVNNYLLPEVATRHLASKKAKQAEGKENEKKVGDGGGQGRNKDSAAAEDVLATAVASVREEVNVEGSSP